MRRPFMRFAAVAARLSPCLSLCPSVGLFLCLFLCFFLWACDPAALLQKEQSDARQPATESTVIGIWRANIPTGKAPPEPTDVKVTLDIEPDHSMLLSRRIATGKPAPYDNVELVKEYWSWSVSDGKLAATKTDCTYKDAQSMEVVSTTCAAPTSESVAIDVEGTAWTMDEGGTPIVYRKN